MQHIPFTVRRALWFWHVTGYRREFQCENLLGWFVRRPTGYVSVIQILWDWLRLDSKLLFPNFHCHYVSSAMQVH
jgi:hypothetical protein